MIPRRLGAVVLLALLSPLFPAVPGVADTWLVPGGQVVSGIPRVVASGGPQGNVFIGSTTQVAELTPDGQVVRVLSSIPGPVTAIAVDADGSIYTTRQTGGSGNLETEVRKTAADGTAAWTRLEYDVQPGGLAIAGGRVWWREMGSVDSATTADGADAAGLPLTGRDLAATPEGHLLLSTTDGTVEYTLDGTEVRRFPQFVGAVTAGPEGHVYGDETGWAWNSGMRLTKLDPLTGARSTGHVGTSYLMDVAAAGGDVVWTVLNDGISWFVVRLDATTPDVALVASEQLTDTNRTVTLDASATSVPFGSVRTFEWDLDGDGLFETSTGSEPRVQHRYSTTGHRSPGVRAVSERGGSSVARVAIDVRAGSPAGPVGVSVNAGARYTNDEVVTVHLRWPTFAQGFHISNDGGFVPAGQAAVASTYRWRLDSSGPERLPKTIYVRFHGGSSGAETYQDDIILDQTKPAIENASAVATTTGTTARARLADRRTYRVRVLARDKTSGVAHMQIGHSKARPGKWVRYKKTRSLTTSKRAIFVRVKDRAGNVSRWNRVL